MDVSVVGYTKNMQCRRLPVVQANGKKCRLYSLIIILTV